MPRGGVDASVLRPAVRQARPRGAHGRAPGQSARDPTFEEAGMAATETPYRVRSLPEETRAPGDDKTFVRLGRALDIGAFGAGAAFQRKAGETVIPGHHEAGPGSDRHEELYVVVQGSATFTVRGRGGRRSAGDRDLRSRPGGVAQRGRDGRGHARPGFWEA